jgi:hypothetical protein
MARTCSTKARSTKRSTNVVSKHAVRVDVTDEFPFLVTELSLYHDR